ncbi:MAG: hypothetical protein AAF480_01745 [Actinomycetota bacterium]
MVAPRWLWLCVVAALMVGSCSSGSSEGQEPTPAPSGSVTAIPTPTAVAAVALDDRIVAGGPLVSVTGRCYGECIYRSQIPRFALYDDGTVVRTDFEDPFGDSLFVIETTEVSRAQADEAIGLALLAGLDSGVVGAAGVLLCCDGGGLIFVSELGAGGTYIHAPWLDTIDAETSAQRAQRAALRNVVDWFESIDGAAGWTRVPVRWAGFIHGDASGGVGGCVDLDSPEPGSDLFKFVNDPSNSFSWASTTPAPDGTGVMTARPLMPHETGCDDARTYSAWFHATDRSIDLNDPVQQPDD